MHLLRSVAKVSPSVTTAELNSHAGLKIILCLAASQLPEGHGYSKPSFLWSPCSSSRAWHNASGEKAHSLTALPEFTGEDQEHCTRPAMAATRQVEAMEYVCLGNRFNAN